jgi:hypothetical protein
MARDTRTIQTPSLKQFGDREEHSGTGENPEEGDLDGTGCDAGIRHHKTCNASGQNDSQHQDCSFVR